MERFQIVEYQIYWTRGYALIRIVLADADWANCKALSPPTSSLTFHKKFVGQPTRDVRGSRTSQAPTSPRRAVRRRPANLRRVGEPVAGMPLPVLPLQCGYQGQSETITKAAPNAQDMTCRRTKLKTMWMKTRSVRTGRSRVCAKVEWPFRMLKRVFGFTKVRYRGIKNNHEWLCVAFVLVNIYQHRRRLARINLRLAPQEA